MQARRAGWPDWRDAAAYAPLLDADRSLFAWEWLRRDPDYCAAAERALPGGCIRRESLAAAAFGLVGFEAPHLGVPDARPMWLARVYPRVLAVDPADGGEAADEFAPGRFSAIATLMSGSASDHLLLSDGLRAIRLDGRRCLFRGGPVRLRYRIEGVAEAEPLVLTLRRFLALCRSGGFPRFLHPREQRARRWILMLRASDAVSAGASQREIAEVLLGRPTAAPGWRLREPSLRSQAQRLVRSARSAANGGYRALLLDRLGRDRSGSSR